MDASLRLWVIGYRREAIGYRREVGLWFSTGRGGLLITLSKLLMQG